jgi:phage terminase large subunit-like protein
VKLILPPGVARPKVPAAPKTPRSPDDWPLAEKVIFYIETFKVPDGPDVGQNIRLRDWQKDFLRAVYNPMMFTSKGDRVRAVRQATMTIARKNGKTSLAGALLLVHLIGPCAIWNGQLFSVAYDTGQAALAYRALSSIVRQDAELSEMVFLTDSAKLARAPQSASSYRAVSAESRNKHGLNPQFVLFDELSQFGKDRELFDVMATSMGAQQQPLMLIISTQASDDSAVLSEIIDYGRKVNTGEVVDPTVHLTEYSVPNELDAWDEANWKLANPALGDFRSLDEMRQFAQRARAMPSMELTFRNLYLNQRVMPTGSFVSPDVWEANARDIDPEMLIGRTCYGGLDLSAKTDLTSFELAFEPEEPGEPIWILSFFWTPEGTLEIREKRDKAPYGQWVAEGFLETTPGNAVDYRYVASRIAELSALYNIKSIGFDRWRIDIMKTWFDEYGLEVPLIPIGQGFKDGSLMVDALEAELLAGTLAHGGHPVLRWNAASAVIMQDPSGNRKFAKNKSLGRIDGIVAMAMAIRTREILGSMVDQAGSPGILVLG